MNEIVIISTDSKFMHRGSTTYLLVSAFFTPDRVQQDNDFYGNECVILPFFLDAKPFTTLWYSTSQVN